MYRYKLWGLLVVCLLVFCLGGCESSDPEKDYHLEGNDISVNDNKSFDEDQSGEEALNQHDYTDEYLSNVEYYSIPSVVIEYIGDENFDQLVKGLSKEGGDVTIKVILEHYGINKSTYSELINPILEYEPSYHPDLLYFDENNLFDEDTLKSNMKTN